MTSGYEGHNDNLLIGDCRISDVRAYQWSTLVADETALGHALARMNLFDQPGDEDLRGTINAFTNFI